MKENKKSIIISNGVKLFNEQGFGAVSLYELANKMGMTRGNLTYHFKNKDLLLSAIADEMWTKLNVERDKSREFPSFENLHSEVQLLYKTQKEYAFIFLDTHVLNNPIIKKRFRAYTNQGIKDNKATIAFSVKNKNMKKEAIPGIYNNIAFITWMLSFYWLSQQTIRGEKSKEDNEKMIWSILLPHFTDKGIHAFKSFFGNEYYESIGDAFDADAYQMASF